MIKLVWRYLFVWVLAPAGVLAAEPQVVASLKPLALIAAEISDNVHTLLPANASHHEFALRTSHMRQLHEADLVLWVGPGLESFLVAPLRHKQPSQLLQAEQLAGLHWPDHHVTAAHDHGRDLHLWLNPHNAVIVAQALAERLVELSPANAAVYRQRAQNFAEAMRQLDTELQLQLAPLQRLGFVVYHDAYNHFVHHYGLRQIDYLALTPDQRPGARHLHQVNEALQEAVCFFSEPGAQRTSVEVLAKRARLLVGELDPLGAQGGIEHYAQLLKAMAESFSACLNQGRL